MVNVYVDRELELNLPMVQTAEVVVVDVVVAVVAEAGLVVDPHQGGVVFLQGDTTGRVQDRLTEEEDEHHPDRDLAACPRIETNETDHLHLRIDVRLPLIANVQLPLITNVQHPLINERDLSQSLVHALE